MCVKVTDEFLQYSLEKGNDLITPMEEYGFPGLKAGDQWCVCAGSWYQAYHAGKACPVQLESTHAKALKAVPLEAFPTQQSPPPA